MYDKSDIVANVVYTGKTVASFNGFPWCLLAASPFWQAMLYSNLSKVDRKIVPSQTTMSALFAPCFRSQAAEQRPYLQTLLKLQSSRINLKNLDVEVMTSFVEDQYHERPSNCLREAIAVDEELRF